MGIVLERREIDHPWQSHSWYPVGVIPGAPEIGESRLLREGPDSLEIHAATLPLELHRDQTEGYKHNVTNEKVPKLYIVLRDDEDAEEGDAPRPFHITACPDEAAAYLDTTATGETVEPVPMPAGVRAWVKAYVDKHHVEEPFEKGRKKRWIERHEREHQGPRGPRPAAGRSAR